MNNFRISIQEKIKAFDRDGLVGETTIEIVKNYFEGH